MPIRVRSYYFRFKIALVRYLFFLLGLSLFFACGEPTHSGDGATDSRTVFHYNQPNTVTSLDPAFARNMSNIWAVDHLYDGLVKLDGQLNVKPSIAKSWTISKDGLTYTFLLRDSIYFHADECFQNGIGRQVEAQDVVYSFNRIIDEQVASPGGWIFKGKVDEEQPFQAFGRDTFVLKLQKAFPPMLSILTMEYCSIVPEEAIEQYAKSFRAHPVGSGPFQLKRWLENQSLILMKNEDYALQHTFEHTNLDGIRVSFINDRKTAYLELLKGKIDLMSGLESSFINELLTPSGKLQPYHKEKLQFYKSPFLNTEYLGINLNKVKGTPLAKKQLRQALNYGFNRKTMLATLRNNVGKPAFSGFVPFGLPSHNPDKVKGYTYSPVKARELLTKAGFPNGEGLPTLTLHTNKDYLDLCTFITRQWKELGINVEIEVVESATLREMMRNDQADFFRASWIADYPDGESFLTCFYSKNPAPPNYTRFSNARFDRLYERAMLEEDVLKRQQLYQQMDQILIEEAPVVFLFYDESAIFTQAGVDGIVQNGLNLLDVRGIMKR